jgi:hypothetical protein
MRWHHSILLFLLAGCAGIGMPGEGDNHRLDPFTGVYRGTFDSALTEDPADDLNFNPCDPAMSDCRTHHAPLADVLLEVDRTSAGALRVRFFRSEADRAQGRPLDLLGDGCGTRLGPVAGPRRVHDADGRRWTATVPLTVQNRVCLGRLRPTSEHELQLAWYEDHVRGQASADAERPSLVVLIDRRVSDANHLYVEEDGVRRRVRIDLANTLEQGGNARYRACIEDELGEFGRCVMTDREFRQVLLPVPLPGGAAVSYTWWHQLTPRLRSTRGLYHLEQYRGHFTLIDD